VNVLHVITNLDDGGAQTVLLRLVAADPDDTHAVVSLTDEGLFGARLAAAGARVSAVGLPRGRVTAAGFTRLVRAVRAARPDVVQTWMYHADLLGGVAARLAGTRAVVWGLRNTDLDPGRVTRQTRLAARACAAVSRAIPRRIVSCSGRAARAHAALGYPADRIVVVANGYDLGAFAPDAAARARVRADLGIAAGQVLLGMVARWDPHKDHTNLFEALALLAAAGAPDWSCALVGRGMDADNPELASLLGRHGIGARVLALGPRFDVPAIMSALDLHVLSSAGEAFPNVVAEAMACGTPAVVTDVGDAALIVGETGWVAPPRDPRALAAAVRDALRALADPAGRAARAAACRERIALQFGLERMVAGYRAVWAAAREG
jgi:glycosyltransferase involved in cell wall biosynthesis